MGGERVWSVVWTSRRLEVTLEGSVLPVAKPNGWDVAPHVAF